MPSTDTAPQGPARVLIVAGSRTPVRSFRSALEAAGFAVATAAGAAGLRRALSAAFDVVVSEVQAPGIDGFGLCRQLAGGSGPRRAPVVLLVERDEPASVLRALAAGAADYVATPCEPEHLVARVRGSLGAGHSAEASDRHRVVFMGGEFAVPSGRDRILTFLLSRLEDDVRARQELLPVRGALAAVGALDEPRAEWDAGSETEKGGAIEGEAVDGLTGLPTRGTLLRRLAGVSGRGGPRRMWAVVSVDVDRLRAVNDSLGHGGGDVVLAEIARRLCASVRAGDLVTRVGGDEFSILLEGVRSPAEARRIAERMHEGLSRPVWAAGRHVFVTASIGAACSSDAPGRPEDVLRSAETAMHRAKRLGRARVELFDGVDDVAAAARLQLETELRHALERGELEVHYEPLVSLVSGETSGFEALVRWRHPRRGTVFPGEFIPIAEETGLIVPIGRWVLREACRQAQAWRRRFAGHPELTISVNVSGRQLDQDDLVARVEEVLSETGLPPRLLHLEITESAVMRDPDVAAGVLARLRTRGVRISIDDFGTGYCSLSYLHQLPCDVLKIDRSFVSRLGVTRDGGSIVRAVTALGRDLGLAVVAEGVETEEQAAELRALGCHYAQGFVRATAARTAEALLDVERRVAVPGAPVPVTERSAWWMRLGTAPAAAGSTPAVVAGGAG